MPNELLFKRLRVAGWRQFALLDIDFHPRLTVPTGANGTGKSTLLNILARHVGIERPYYSVPKRGENGIISFLAGRLGWSGAWTSRLGEWLWKPPEQIGEIEYTDGTSSPLTLPPQVGSSYQIGIPSQQGVIGLVVSSHRLMPQYQPVPNIPFQGISPEQVFGMFLNEAHNRYVGGHSGNSLIFQIKQALAAWAAIGEGNSVLQANPAQREAYRGFVDMLRKVLPATLGFIDLSIRPPDVVLVTRSGEFMIDAASGGITTLIEIGALIYACTINPAMKDKRFVVVYDEPENHLHPLLQRTLFPNLTNAFPNVQFVAASHSPFIVSSLKDSNVYVLRYENTDGGEATEQSRVVSQKLDYLNRAGSTSEILREVLGLPSTLPLWVETDLGSIVERYQTRELNAALLVELKADLKSAGLSEFFSVRPAP